MKLHKKINDLPIFNSEIAKRIGLEPQLLHFYLKTNSESEKVKKVKADIKKALFDIANEVNKVAGEI